MSRVKVWGANRARAPRMTGDTTVQLMTGDTNVQHAAHSMHRSRPIHRACDLTAEQCVLAPHDSVGLLRSNKDAPLPQLACAPIPSHQTRKANTYAPDSGTTPALHRAARSQRRACSGCPGQSHSRGGSGRCTATTAVAPPNAYAQVWLTTTSPQAQLFALLASWPPGKPLTVSPQQTSGVKGCVFVC